MPPQQFGSYCSDLSEVITDVPNPFFRIEGNGVLYLTEGFTQTEKGTGWFDHAVLFCPFCGTQLQASEEIAKRARS